MSMKSSVYQSNSVTHPGECTVTHDQGVYSELMDLVTWIFFPASCQFFWGRLRD